MTENEEILTVHEAAFYLKLNEKTVLKLAQKREIPSVKISSKWRFKKNILDKWLKYESLSGLKKKLHNPPYQIHHLKKIPKKNPTNKSHKNLLPPMKRIFRKPLIIPSIRPDTREKILCQLTKPLINEGLISNADSFVKKLIEREEISSTALNNGIALPHIKNAKELPFDTPAVIFGLSPGGVYFDPESLNPTYLFILLCSKSEILYLNLLSRLGKIFREPQTVKQMAGMKNPDEIYGFLIKKEKELFFK